jgi:Holliday junction resolvase RusA-like endonuclease
MLQFTILGEPIPKQSARHSVNNGKIHSWQPPVVTNAVAHIRQQLIDQLPQDFIPYNNQPLSISITFYFIKPQSTRKNVNEKITKPDLDNLQKLVLDAMQGIVYHNDANIVKLYSYKTFGEKAKTTIFVENISEGDTLL